MDSKRRELSIVNHENFKVAVTKVPEVDVDYVLRHCGEGVDRDETKRSIAYNAWYNRICSNCGNKKNVKKLKKCSGCYLIEYCNRECQRNHWSIHKLRCSPNHETTTQLNHGYQGIFIGKPTKKLGNDELGTQYPLSEMGELEHVG